MGLRELFNPENPKLNKLSEEPITIDEIYLKNTIAMTDSNDVDSLSLSMKQ